RLHGDDTTVPLLARGKTVTARLWTYVRDDRPFAGPAPPAALFYFSRDRTAEHPKRHLARYAGILQADAYAGYGELYWPSRKPGAIREAACWAHFRRKVFELAEVARAPLAAEAVQRIDQVFEAERVVNGCPATDRLTHRQHVVTPLVADLHSWMLATRGRLSRHNDLARALDYALKRWPAFTRFLDDGRICLSNNAAERALRGIALGRKAWLFAGSDRGGERAAMIYTLITTAKLNDLDPRAWLADVLARIADHPASRLDQLLPWNWHRTQTPITAAAAAASASTAAITGCVRCVRPVEGGPRLCASEGTDAPDGAHDRPRPGAGEDRAGQPGLRHAAVCLAQREGCAGVGTGPTARLSCLGSPSGRPAMCSTVTCRRPCQASLPTKCRANPG
ncbi:MAG: transposase, partial [Roseomonas sp.]|nr:transposase [Roseomonas sp.]